MIARKAEFLILGKWRQDPTIHNASIETFTLARKAGTRYTGFIEAIIDGLPQRFSVSVILVGNTLNVTWEPADE
jgi:hypothetical protein